MVVVVVDVFLLFEFWVLSSKYCNGHDFSVTSQMNHQRSMNSTFRLDAKKNVARREESQ
jgi:hypothetical protein